MSASDAQNPDVAYWFHEARAYLKTLDRRGILDATEHGVRGHHESGVVVVTCPTIEDREAMTDIILHFERGGFTIESTTTDEHVAITADGDRLTVPYTDTTDEEVNQ